MKQRTKEKAEAEKAARPKALKPDKEKLIKWIAFFDEGKNNPAPILKSEDANSLLGEILGSFEIFLQDAIEQIEDL